MTTDSKERPSGSFRRPDRVAALRLMAVLTAAGLLVAMAPASAAEDSASLRRALAVALEAERWEEAIELGRQSVALEPGDPIAHYNLACAYALGGAPDEAMASLGRAAELGFSDARTVTDDPDLDDLRSLPEFAGLRSRIEANHTRAFTAFRERADRTVPLLYLPEPLPEGPLPLVVLLHGRGGRAQNMAEFWRSAASRSGVILVVPQSLDPFGRGYEWRRIVEAEYLVERATAYVKERHAVDATKLIVAGFSQGGYVALGAVSRAPEVYAGAIAIGSAGDDTMPLPPNAESGGPRFYLGVGAEDRVAEACRATAQRFREAGVEYKLRVYPGVGHAFPQNYRLVFERALRYVLRR